MEIQRYKVNTRRKKTRKKRRRRRRLRRRRRRRRRKRMKTRETRKVGKKCKKVVNFHQTSAIAFVNVPLVSQQGPFLS